MYYATVGGISLPELNYLEAEMFHLLKFELYVKPSDFHNCSLEIKAHASVKTVPMVPETTSCVKPAVEGTTTIGSIKTLPSNAEMTEDMAS